MYNLPHFKEHDPAVIKDFMRQNPFVILCGTDGNNLPVATQVPILMEERGDKLFLIGHVQRKTDHQVAFELHPDVLVIFTGAHSYVSASWYADPQTASTWNYMSVQAKGKLQFLDDAALLQILSQTTAHFENDPHSAALVEKMPEAYVHKTMKAIIGFEIEVTSLDHVFKLSQNRDEKTYHNIISHLEDGDAGAKAVAEEMGTRTGQLFKK